MSRGKEKTVHEQLDELSIMIRQIRDGKRKVEVTSEHDKKYDTIRVKFEYKDEDQ